MKGKAVRTYLDWWLVQSWHKNRSNITIRLVHWLPPPPSRKCWALTNRAGALQSLACHKERQKKSGKTPANGVEHLVTRFNSARLDVITFIPIKNSQASPAPIFTKLCTRTPGLCAEVLLQKWTKTGKYMWHLRSKVKRGFHCANFQETQNQYILKGKRGGVVPIVTNLT